MSNMGAYFFPDAVYKRYATMNRIPTILAG